MNYMRYPLGQASEGETNYRRLAAHGERAKQIPLDRWHLTCHDVDMTSHDDFAGISGATAPDGAGFSRITIKLARSLMLAAGAVEPIAPADVYAFVRSNPDAIRNASRPRRRN